MATTVAVPSMAEEGEKAVRCKFCHHISNGGITRLKEHLAQTHKGVAPCVSVPDDIKKEIRESLDKIRASKSKQTELLREIGEGPQSMSTQSSKVGSVGGNSIGCSGSGSGESKGKGTLHGFVSSEPRQTTLNSTYKKDLLVDVKRRIGRFIYSAALPFNVVNDPYWLPMVEGIAEYGRGFKPPSMHELRTWILKGVVDGINLIYEEHKKAWKKYGCTIMSDGWTDGKNRSLINFLVNSPAGTFFLKSIDASDSIKNGELIFKYLNDVVDEVGEENVIQIVTDNASNCIKAGKKIMETRHRIWWTPCAAHCIDLMLEDIAKLKIFSDTIEHAKMVVKFLYGHGTILSLMRKYTNGKEILRPAVTRFATSFLTLQSMYKVKRPLEQMFASEDWVSSPLSQTTQGKVVKRIVINDPNFWPHVAFCVKSVVPLVSVLREVDSEERSAMGYIYELMDKAKETIKFNCGGVDRNTNPFGKKLIHDGLHNFIILYTRPGTI
ncbi:uncharacterized protein LOC122043620 [Zingiber officinale]|uniref:uncharacterized protein LOC122043620 n=1 Tax=Zingiber officinale TaxID=94328 RepID=UPI001C4B8B3F|nr:uncharacterized protein LOC122043620 [Zingiber officinale]